MNNIKDNNAFLKGKFLNIKNTEPMYGIYQLKNNSDLRYHRFIPLDLLTEAGYYVEYLNYDFIYADYLSESGNLDEIYERFNRSQLPTDFRGHSLSISDIIAIKENGKITANYVDEFGFQEIPDFLNSKPLSNITRPTVTIRLTESDYFYEGQILPLYEANGLFKALDSIKNEERKSFDDGYDKVYFTINYIQDGKPCIYEGRFDIGDGDGSLVSHIRARAEYYLSTKGQAFLEKMGTEKVKESTAEYQYQLNKVVPYFILHNELTYLDNDIEMQLSKLFTTKEDSLKKDYYTSVKGYIFSCRRNLNTRTGIPFPEFPNWDTINLTKQEKELLIGHKHHIALLPRPVSEGGNQDSVKKKSDIEM